MNNVVLVGRIASDLELKNVGQGTSLITFNVAVDRRFKNQKGERETDFIRCVAWRQTADFIEKYFSKGQKIGLIGEINTRNFDGQDGKRVYITEVKVDQVHFVESKGSQEGYNRSNRGESATRTRSNSWGDSTPRSASYGAEKSFDNDYGLPFDI